MDAAAAMTNRCSKKKQKTRPFFSSARASFVAHCHPFRHSGNNRNLSRRLVRGKSAGRGFEREETEREEKKKSVSLCRSSAACVDKVHRRPRNPS